MEGEMLIPPGRDVKKADPDYRHLAEMDREALVERWSSTEGRQIVSAWKAGGFTRDTISKLVGKLNGKLDLRGISLCNESLRQQDLSDCDLYGADLRQTDLYNADLRRSYLSEAQIQGATLSWIKVDDTFADNVHFDRSTKLLGIDLSGINTNFAFHLIAESRDQQRVAELKERHPVLACLLWITCDYGHSVWRWTIWTLATILLFGLIFSAFPWLLHHPEGVVHPGEGFYFSVVTFTTLGFGDIYPATTMARVLVSIEVVLGYLMGGVFIAILTKQVLG
jgi:hypothetical protein